ncbi:MAG: putative peptidase [Frankiales bacterium]|jgi:cell wall-associated NlpC family hydrolase|nr:putative peptidase [Frankiales bacterium]
MRSALPSSGLFPRYVPRHAAAREPLAGAGKTVAAAGLTAALLPLGALPALADEPGAADSSGSTATTSDTSTATTSPSAEPSPSASSSRAPASGSFTAPGRSKTAKATTDLRMSAPARAKAGRVPVSVRLRADSRGLRNGSVRLETSTGSGWTYAGRLLTNQHGVGSGTLKLATSARLRAVYPGTDHRLPDATPAQAVTVSNGEAQVLQIAAQYAGRPYRYGSTGPSSFDCSGFTRFVFAKLGKSLPHNSGAQARVTQRIPKSQAQPGDLVFLGGGRIGHVGIYAGNGKMWDAPRAGKSVSLRRIYSSDYIVGRVL